MRKYLPILALLFLYACGGQNGGKDAASDGSLETIVPFTPYALEDSSRIEAFPSGLKLYRAMTGPGDFPKGGTHVRVHYHGMLPDGTVFDSSFDRAEPLHFTVGSGKMIPGFSEGIRRLRYGSKAILIIPPELGYGAEGREPNIPGNSSLIFHVELLGAF